MRLSACAGRALFVSFDDDRLGELPLEQLGLLLEEYYRRFPELRGREEVHWFLDEIQLVPGWERFVRRAIDSEIVEIAVSGSSARMLSREVHTSLRHRGEEPGKEPARWTSAERSLVEKRFREYLVEGGFPEAQGHGVAKDTAHAMFGHLLDAFLISAVTLATDSERRRNSNPRKVYPVDAGLIGAFDAVGRANLGHALETVVWNELESRKARVVRSSCRCAQIPRTPQRWSASCARSKRPRGSIGARSGCCSC